MEKENKKNKKKQEKKKKDPELETESSPEELDPLLGLEEERFIIINNIEQPSNDSSSLIRTIPLYGDLTETVASDIVQSFMFLRELSQREDPEDCKPIEFLISTLGGVAAEMFAIYDTMRMVKESCEVSTIAMGKVMSAGVVLLAAGTKGKRKIGANCRVMIHSVNGGYHGSLLNMENEIEEVRWIQDRYVECLAAETKMTEREIRKYLKKHVDVYLSAEEAIELGIADIIV